MVSIRCADCRVKCAYREHLLRKDADSTCIVPMRREMALAKGENISFLDEIDLNGVTKEIIDFLLDAVRESKDERKAMRLAEVLIELKKAWYPAAQTNKNINVNLFENQLNKWLEVETKIAEYKKNNPVEITVQQPEVKKEDL